MSALKPQDVLKMLREARNLPKNSSILNICGKPASVSAAAALPVLYELEHGPAPARAAATTLPVRTAVTSKARTTGGPAKTTSTPAKTTSTPAKATATKTTDTKTTGAKTTAAKNTAAKTTTANSTGKKTTVKKTAGTDTQTTGIQK